LIWLLTTAREKPCVVSLDEWTAKAYSLGIEPEIRLMTSDCVRGQVGRR
jgi:hypothetical protein